MKISKRELFLVFFLGLVGVVGVMVAFVILPLQAGVDANRQILSDLEFQKSQYESVQINLEERQKALDKRLLEVGTLMNDTIMTPLNEAQFDQWIAPLLVKYNAKLLDSQFEEPMVVEPQSLEMLYAAPIYELKTLVDRYHQVEYEDDIVPTSTNTLLMSIHMYHFGSTYDNYRAILNEISSWDTSVYVMNSSFDYAKKEAVITLNVYMMEKLIPDENPHVYSTTYEHR